MAFLQGSFLIQKFIIFKGLIFCSNLIHNIQEFNSKLEILSSNFLLTLCLLFSS